MIIEIYRHGKWESHWTTKAKVTSMPYGTLLEIDRVNYPIYPSQGFYIRDEDEPSMIPVEGKKGPRSGKYKQTKMDL